MVYSPFFFYFFRLEDKIRTVATEIYGAADIAISGAAKTKLKKFTKMGYGHFPICVAKNQYSFSADPKGKHFDLHSQQNLQTTLYGTH